MVKRTHRQPILPSLRDGIIVVRFQALRARLPSFSPHGTTEFASKHEPHCPAGAYLIAPIVNPRTNCLETMILNMITGRAIMVPVAMICPQGKS